jgi:predicted phage tail protein
VDFLASKGLYYANDNGSLSSVSISLQIEARAINDVGTPIGDWVVLNSSTDAIFTGATTTPQRYSLRFPVTHGRYEMRVKRLDTESSESRSGHAIAWIGLRSYLNNVSAFGDVTLLALRMRASNNLSSQASRKINVIATRKLPIWNGISWSEIEATTSIAWPLAYACKSVGMTDAQIDLPMLLALDAIWGAREDSFNGRFDSFLSFWEAVTKIAGSGRAKPYLQGGVMRFMRDQLATVPVALFSMRNIIAGSFTVDYLMPTPETADQVDVGYFDQDTWTSARVPAILPGVAPIRPIKVDLFGVTSRAQAHREGMYLAATNRFRRKAIKFSTEMEGFIPSFGDLIAIQHDMPAWGQAGEVVGWNSQTRTITLSEMPTWGEGTHYIGLRKRDGSVAGPYVVTAGEHGNELILAVQPSLTPYVGTGEERTHYSFGWAENWRQRARVIAARPQGLNQVSIEAVNEDDNVHTADQGIITPVAPASQLSGYVNAPVVTGVTVTPMLYKPNVLVIAWQPAPWASYYVVQQSSDGVVWTEAGNTGLNTLTITALYGSTTYIRVAAFGLTRGSWAYPGAVTVDQTPPPLAPTAFATGGMFSVQLNWTFGDAIGGRTGTEIWWCATSNLASASRLSVEPFPSQSYLHVGLAPGQGGYYWIRVGDIYGHFSPYYPSEEMSGLHALAITDPSDLLTFLNEAIGTTQLTANLNTKVTLIDTVNSKVTQAAADIFAEASARGAAITNESTIRQAAESSIAQTVTTLSAATATNIAAAVQTEATARTNADTSLASSITTVAASVITANAAIQTEATTRANADAATAGTIATVVASVVTANAAIQSEVSTRVSGDSAQAALTAAVQARLDTGDFATVNGIVGSVY